MTVHAAPSWVAHERQRPVGAPPVATLRARRCARPQCAEVAAATLTFAYVEREAWIDDLRLRPEPGTYDLCVQHAARTRPPHGWALRDRRPGGPSAPGPTPPIGLGDLRDAAGSPAAERTGPEAVSEDALAPAGVLEVDRPATSAAREPGPAAEPAPTLWRGTPGSWRDGAGPGAATVLAAARDARRTG